MTKLFKPMLATDADLDNLRFPLLASAKLDGIRAIVRDGVVYSRRNKPIPNKFVQAKFKHLEHFDGELIVGEPTAHDVYRQTTSGVMSVEGKPSVQLFVFDHIKDISAPYSIRGKWLDDDILQKTPVHVVLHPQVIVHSLAELLTVEDLFLDQGYEGLILRDPNAPYKMGRSTAREGYLLKLKRFQDDEATVIGFEERMHNGNAATINELGRTSRSSHKAGKSGRGDLGALLLRNSSGVEFACGTGFSDPERSEIWAAQDHYLGKIAKYKFFPVGVKKAPRHPVFLGWRDRRDM